MEKIKPAAQQVERQTGFVDNTQHKSKTKFNIKSPGCRIIPAHCPRFKKCCANICPLDPDWELRTHQRDEPVCFYLRELVKSGTRPKFVGGLTRKTLEVIAKAYPKIISRWYDVKKQLERSARKGTRIGQQPGKRIKAAA